MNKIIKWVVGIVVVLVIIGVITIIVFFPESLDNDEDATTKAGLRSAVASSSFCRNKEVQEEMDAIFLNTPVTIVGAIGNNNQDQYTDGPLATTTKNGCVSNSEGDWVMWADLSTTAGRAWCVDSSGADKKVHANDNNSDIYTIKVSDGVLDDISCESIRVGKYFGFF